MVGSMGAETACDDGHALTILDAMPLPVVLSCVPCYLVARMSNCVGILVVVWVQGIGVNGCTGKRDSSRHGI